MSGQAYRGGRDVNDGTSDFNAMSFLARQIVAGLATATLVQVIAVHGGGSGGSPATVDVQPMVNQIDGQGNATAHGTIFGIPCYRQQGGSCASIIDPVVGDIGLAIFASRDISAVKASGKISNPGSFRRFDWSDGLYIGAFLGAAPTSFVQVTAGLITLKATTVNVVGTLQVNGTTVTVP